MYRSLKFFFFEISSFIHLLYNYGLVSEQIWPLLCWTQMWREWNQRRGPSKRSRM